jgi:hypothetical protein
MSPDLPQQMSADTADPGIHDARQRRAILIAGCMALAAVIASVSGLNVATLEMAVAFNASQSTVLWISTRFSDLHSGASVMNLQVRNVTPLRSGTGMLSLRIDPPPSWLPAITR